MRVVSLGLAIGVAISFPVARAMQSLLYEISAFDPWTFAFVVLALGARALAACVVPAWRATRLDPLAALRE
jgi:ABC-type antimicrobial peptide transport system permease subunit